MSVKKWNASVMETVLRIFETNSALIVFLITFFVVVNSSPPLTSLTPHHIHKKRTYKNFGIFCLNLDYDDFILHVIEAVQRLLFS